MPAPMHPRRRPQLRHVVVRMRVSVDPKKWAEVFGEPGDLVEAVRAWAPGALERSSPVGVVAAVRRDQL